MAARGLEVPDNAPLFYHPSMTHLNGDKFPALVARVDDPDGEPVAIHRVYLDPEGEPRKADLKDDKLSLGPTKGNAVRLTPHGPTLGIPGLRPSRSQSTAQGR